MVPGLALAATVYIALNLARYHTIWDVGLNYIPNIGDTVQNPRWALKYLHFNLYTLLFMAPKHDDTLPYIHPQFFGQALILTSPAFILTLRPSFRRTWWLLLCAFLVSAPMLFHFTNGYGQFGARHFIPAYPFLLSAMAMGEVDQLAKILIVLSIILVAFGMWHIHEWGMVSPW